MGCVLTAESDRDPERDRRRPALRSKNDQTTRCAIRDRAE